MSEDGKQQTAFVMTECRWGGENNTPEQFAEAERKFRKFMRGETGWERAVGFVGWLLSGGAA